MITEKQLQQITKIKNSQASAEWYTPIKYIAAARYVLGEIELDPASNRRANKVVKADRYYNLFEDGLSRRWRAKTIWLNAPGRKHGSGQAVWQEKLIKHYAAGDVEAAIMLIYNASAVDTVWFHDLLGYYPICIHLGRIKFTPPKGKYVNDKKNQPVHGNAFCYLGPHVKLFTTVFGAFGEVIPAYKLSSK